MSRMNSYKDGRSASGLVEMRGSGRSKGDNSGQTKRHVLNGLPLYGFDPNGNMCSFVGVSAGKGSGYSARELITPDNVQTISDKYKGQSAAFLTFSYPFSANGRNQDLVAAINDAMDNGFGKSVGKKGEERPPEHLPTDKLVQIRFVRNLKFVKFNSDNPMCSNITYIDDDGSPTHSMIWLKSNDGSPAKQHRDYVDSGLTKEQAEAGYVGIMGDPVNRSQTEESAAKNEMYGTDVDQMDTVSVSFLWEDERSGRLQTKAAVTFNLSELDDIMNVVYRDTMFDALPYQVDHSDGYGLRRNNVYDMEQRGSQFVAISGSTPADDINGGHEQTQSEYDDDEPDREVPDYYPDYEDN